MNEPIVKIERILKSEYSTEGFVSFIKEIFDSIKVIAPDKKNKEISNFNSHIETHSHIGSYISPDNKKIAVFEVQLKAANFVENARSIQRSYARKLIESGNVDGAIIAFYTQGDPKWRISFVRLDYEMKFEGGKFKAQENLTPAKRYSFLVGKDEPCHTAISRFHKFIIDKNYNPTLDEIEEAFSVEKVTKEFFDLYSEKFYQLQEYLVSNKDFIAESIRCGFSSEQFAKKLLGQIVFLYFLQKKGWLGVNVWPKILSEEDYNKVINSGGNSTRGELVRRYFPCVYKNNGTHYQFVFEELDNIPDEAEILLADLMPEIKVWGEGSQTFLRDCFTQSQKMGKSFYESTLKPLLYDALNKNRGGINYCPALHCRIPFLSGGLFEPIDNYDWENTHFDIPDSIFSNKCKNHVYDADGILDVFDRYNFTMSEEEPMEQEVAIDPEMLGKVFENLLEVKDRRSIGAFYTPREIVHYMCQNALIYYLTDKTTIAEGDIRDFVLFGDFMKDDDTDYEKRHTNGGMWISQNIFDLDEDDHVTVNRLWDIDNALASVRVLDPAVGSGAFPLCMVNEIVRLRQIITAYLTIGMDPFEKDLFCKDGRTSYWLKYNAIRDCIFAVDIKPSAVDIAQLRLWLSLVIDTDINPSATSPLDGMINPMPLPNLESNILCADSLVDVYGDMLLFRKGGVISCDIDTIVAEERKPIYAPLFKALFEEQDKLFNCDNPVKKKEIKGNINALKKAIVTRSIGQASQVVSEAYEKILSSVVRPCTLWQIDFSRVFLLNGGFDIVIANPPYVQLQKKGSEESNEKVGDKYENLQYYSFTKTGDMYCLFYELGVSLLRKGGYLTYITSNKWLRTAYGEKLRSFFADNTNPRVLIDFSGTRVFETAGVDVCIQILSKAKNEGITRACTIKEPCGSNIDSYVNSHSGVSSFDSGDIWNILSDEEARIYTKILAVGKPLEQWRIKINYGIKTGLNEVFVINGQMKKQLCEEDPRTLEILKPLLKGRNITKWECRFNDLWLILIHNGNAKKQIAPLNVDNYPAVKKYLESYYDKLQVRADQGKTPFHLRDCAYLNDFFSPKIIFQEMEQSPAFAFDREGKYMCLDTARIVTGEHLEYLTALMNSNLFFFAVKHYFGGGRLGANGVRMKDTFFKKFTAYVPTDAEEKQIKDLVLSKTTGRDKAINEFFYEKYNIRKEEAQYIEKDIGVEVYDEH